MNLKQVKEHLRIDHEEDNDYLQFLIDTSESLLFSLTNKLDENSALYDELFLCGQKVETYTEHQVKLAEAYRLAVIAEMYENRGLTAEGANNKIKPIYSSILANLMYSPRGVNNG